MKRKAKFNYKQFLKTASSRWPSPLLRHTCHLDSLFPITPQTHWQPGEFFSNAQFCFGKPLSARSKSLSGADESGDFTGHAASSLPHITQLANQIFIRWVKLHGMLRPLTPLFFLKFAALLSSSTKNISKLPIQPSTTVSTNITSLQAFSTKHRFECRNVITFCLHLLRKFWLLSLLSCIPFSYRS